MAGVLLVLVFGANLAAMQLVRGSLAVAAEAGARSAAVVGGSVEGCPERGLVALDASSGLRFADVSVHCRREAGVVIATAGADVPWWIGPFPPASLRATAHAPVEFDERLLMEASPPSSG